MGSLAPMYRHYIICHTSCGIPFSAKKIRQNADFLQYFTENSCTNKSTPRVNAQHFELPLHSTGHRLVSGVVGSRSVSAGQKLLSINFWTVFSQRTPARFVMAEHLYPQTSQNKDNICNHFLLLIKSEN